MVPQGAMVRWTAAHVNQTTPLSKALYSCVHPEYVSSTYILPQGVIF